MNENNINITELAPFIRGCCLTGEAGPTVIPKENWELAESVKSDENTVVVSLPDGGIQKEEKIEELVAAGVSEYRLRTKKVPSCIVVDNTVFTLGEDDEAVDVGQIAFDRNKVVKNKIAVVTGGAQGFGEGLVRQLASAGAIVFVADLNYGGAEKLCGELNSEHGRTAAIPVEVNVGDEASVAAMVEFVVSRTGGIDLFISNAGVLKAGSVKEMELKDFRFVTDINYIGYFIGVKHVSPVMAAQNRGARALDVQLKKPYFSDIIQINSKSGLEGSNKNGAYAGGKFGGIGLTQSFAKELVTDNIKVNSICPGNFFDGPLWSDPEKGLFVQYLRTGKVPGAESIADVKRFYESKVPMDRGCTVEDVIKAVYYVVEQRYETGQAIPVTGGQVMLS